MPDTNKLKEYFINNKNTVALFAGFLAILCAFAFIIFNGFHKNSEIPSADNNDAQEFIVYDYDEQKLKYLEAKEKQQLKEMAVLDEIADDNSMENILSKLPIEDNKISVNIRTAGRNNPFSPYTERNITNGAAFDIIEPPEYIPDEPQAQDLMQTTVSGILYNAQKSSAIINVDGTDQLVNKGDKIAGFQIVDITKNKVFVKKGYNIISAGVGEAIETPALTYNNVYNLSNKFGGKYTKIPQKGVITINGESN